MQRGTVRARSPSPIGIDAHSGTAPSTSPVQPTYRPELKRQRRRERTYEQEPASIIATGVHTGVATRTTTSPSAGKMGRESNGNRAGNGAGPSGTSTNGNGHADTIDGDATASHLAQLIAHVTPAEGSGGTMYPDDDDWAERQHVIESDADIEMGDSYTAGGPSSHAVANTKRMPVDKEEFVRLVLQGLRDVGYEQAASVLEAESGVTLATQPVIDLQAAILGGRWSESLSLLQQLDIIPSTDEEPSSSASSMRSAGKAKDTGNGQGRPDAIRFLISRQKYLEMLEVGQSKKALAVLRSELAGVVRDPDVLHTLSGFMMCVDRDDLFERAQWDGAAGSSRQRLLEALQEHIPPSIMVPSRRISVLFDQARTFQRQSCLYHTDTEPFSLYTNHECQAGAFPSATTHILADHKDEVHALAWSPDGSLLASAGGDGLVVIWQLTIVQADPDEADASDEGPEYRFAPLHQLKDHQGGVGIVSFSPDGKTLVSASDRQLYFWDVETGTLKKMKTTLQLHTDEISAVRWKPDGSSVLVSSMDQRICFYSPEGELQRKLETNGILVRDFDITPDGGRLVLAATIMKRGNSSAAGSVNRPKPAMSGRSTSIDASASGAAGGVAGVGAVASDPVAEFGYDDMSDCVVYVNTDNLEILWVYNDIKNEVTSVSISGDCKRALVSAVGGGIHLLSLEPTMRLIRKFEGHVQRRFLLRSAFGAGRDRFVLTGSEDGKIYVYQTSQSRAIEVLVGHQGTVNAVAWSPVPGRPMLASCSDDNEVRIWQPPRRD